MGRRRVAGYTSTAMKAVILTVAQLFSFASAHAEDAGPLPVNSHSKLLDDPCAAISAAFIKTFTTPRFSYQIKVTTNGKLNRIERNARIVESQLYLKTSKGDWSRHNLSLQLPSASLFHICVRQSATSKAVHYSAWVTNEGPMVPIDIWVSIQTGKLERTSRSYSATGQSYHGRTVEQEFSYDESSTTIPKHYIQGDAFSGLWPGDDDLR